MITSQKSPSKELWGRRNNPTGYYNMTKNNIKARNLV